MFKLTLLPGDNLWSSNGTHIPDDDGFVKICSDFITLDVNDSNIIHKIRAIIEEEREQNTIINTLSNIDLWITQNTEYPFDNIIKGTLLIPHPSWSNIYIPKTEQSLSSDIYAITYKSISKPSFEPVLIPKKIPKINTVTKTYFEKETISNTTEKVVYDPDTERYVMRSYTVQTDVTETVNIYNDAGDIIGQQELPKIIKIEKQVDENVYDEYGNMVYEDVLDANGQQVLIPQYQLRYYNGISEISYEEYAQTPGSSVAIKVSCRLI